MNTLHSERATDSITLSDVFDTKDNNLDFLRFLFAGLVLFQHSFSLLGNSPDPLARLSHGQTNFGEVSVDCFFIISGFLITRSWLNTRSPFDYLKRRILRIYPGFIVAFLITLFVFGPLGASDKVAYLHSIHPLRLVLDLLQLHRPPDLPAFIHNHRPRELNGSLWTIAIEFQCYLAVILLGYRGWLHKHRRVLGLFIVCLIAQAGLEYNIPGLHHLELHLPAFIQYKLPLFGYFLAGMVMQLFARQIEYQWRLFLAALSILCFTLVTTGWNFCFPVCGGYALLYISFNNNFKAQRWGQLGDFSYGTYLYAWPIQQLLVMMYMKLLNPYLLTAAACVATWTCAALSWFIIEKPCLKLKGSSRSNR